MIRKIALQPLTAALLAAGVFACSGPHPTVREGDANSVEVGFAGDVASAWPVARRHCAQYEKVPQLVDAGLDRAIFDCVRR